MRYAPKRLYQWSPQIAYSVGLMASDGCLSKDGRHLDLTSTDREQLENFALVLGKDYYIGTKYNAKGMPAYRIQFGDTAYYDFLVKAGLTPAKSKTLGNLSVPDEFYADFLRGLYDGDGSSYGYKDHRWRSAFMFYSYFASASPPFMQYIQKTNNRLAQLNLVTIRKARHVYVIAYAKADSRKLFNFMYYEGHGPCLTRKKVKLASFIERCKTDIISP